MGVLHAEVLGTREVWLSLWATSGGGLASTRWLLELDVRFRLVSGPQPSVAPIPRSSRRPLERAALENIQKHSGDIPDLATSE